MKRYAKENNKYMGEKSNPNEKSKFIQYLDANNLYGWAMSCHYLLVVSDGWMKTIWKTGFNFQLHVSLRSNWNIQRSFMIRIMNIHSLQRD